MYDDRSIALCTLLSSVGNFVDDFNTLVDKCKNISSFILKM